MAQPNARDEALLAAASQHLTGGCSNLAPPMKITRKGKAALDLDPKLLKRVERAAKRAGISVDEWMRQAAENRLKRPAPDDPGRIVQTKPQPF